MKPRDRDELAFCLFLIGLVAIILLCCLLYYLQNRPTSPAAQADSMTFLEAEPPDRRPAIARYVAGVTARHGHGPDPAAAANQLLYLEQVGGAKAGLVAAMVWAESRWDLRTRNLVQILRATSRSVYGPWPRTWEQNLYQGSTYLQDQIDAELDARHPEPVRAGLARYNGGRRKPPASWAYAKRVLHERAKLP